MVRLVSFNVNGVRARLHQLEALVECYAPDLIGLQEIKASDADFPIEALQALGYDVTYYGQKGHYGVAILSRQPLLSTFKGYPWDAPDAQRRLVGVTVELAQGQRVTIINGYFPQGESQHHPTKFANKKQFYADLQRFLSETYHNTDPLVVMGDFNIAPCDRDIGIGEDNRKRWLRTGKCCFLPEERAWFNGLESWGLVDTFGVEGSDIENRFSWFDYRSKGFDREPKRGLRIDHILVTAPLAEKCRGVGIAYDIRSMEKPSDHCPVWADFDFG